MKGVRGGVERRRGRGLKARRERRKTTGKVLKDRRSPRRRGRMGTSVWTHHTAATCFAASSSIPDSFATVFCKPSAPLTSSDVDASEDGAQSLATPTRSASSKTFVRLISWKWIAAGGFAADAEASSPGPVAAASSPSSPGAVSFFSAIAAAAAALSPAASAADFAWRDEEGGGFREEKRTTRQSAI